MYKEIEAHLTSLGNSEIAAHSQKYFKTGEGEYGHGDIFLGIRVPVVRKMVRKFKTASLKDAEKLLASKYHECRLFALLLMVYRFSRGDEAEKRNIYNHYLDNTCFINNWDLVDCSAKHIIGPYLENKNRSVLDRLAKSSFLWDRRIAVMTTFHFIANNEFEDTFRIAALLLNDPEDLIHKATGWMLREIGKKDLEAEKAFLSRHYRKMPRTMLRYAIEKMSKEERQNYLNGKI